MLTKSREPYEATLPGKSLERKWQKRGRKFGRFTGKENFECVAFVHCLVPKLFPTWPLPSSLPTQRK